MCVLADCVLSMCVQCCILLRLVITHDTNSVRSTFHNQNLSPPKKLIVILSYHLLLDFLNDLFIRGFCTKNLYTFLVFSVLATCPAHAVFIQPGNTTRIWKLSDVGTFWYGTKVLTHGILGTLNRLLLEHFDTEQRFNTTTFVQTEYAN